MALCQVKTSNVQLSPSQDIILTWGRVEKNVHHTKPEYLKIMEDAQYEVNYEIKWQSTDATTQPFEATIYKVSKEFTLHALQRNVTVCVGNPITLKKSVKVALAKGERVCIGAKNFSTSQMILIECKFSLVQI
jgi:hypothetical protein